MQRTVYVAVCTHCCELVGSDKAWSGVLVSALQGYIMHPRRSENGDRIFLRKVGSHGTGNTVAYPKQL
jgi:hypothetical protein